MLRMLSLVAVFVLAGPALSQEKAKWINTSKSGAWSNAATWVGGKLPTRGDRVLVRSGHRVVYDVDSDNALRAVHVSGTLTFARDRDTRLDVGLLRIEAGDNPSEDGFDCDGHVMDIDEDAKRPALEIGTPEAPIPAKFTARIRLTYFAGTNKESLPALVCCGGRMDLHGNPMSRTWLKLGLDANKGQRDVTLAEEPKGWKVGDRVIVTATKSERGTDGTRRPSKDDVKVETEERLIEAIDGAKITLDKALTFDHKGLGEFRGAVANLSRNVVVESADPAGQRGHTMYHRGSAGSLSYAEFRHLGKENVLGRYSIHFHLAGSTMRGSYLLGLSIWDSHNRWITIHGTNYLLVRDCVGYQSVGHGFFFEDGTEVHNVLDRNLAVQAFKGKLLPKQILPFDANDGAGFWWSNSLNTFTNNVSCENDRYGFRFEATQSSAMKMTIPVLQADGRKRPVDIRTLPFVRFENNEAHCDGRYGFNLGEGVERVGPDANHPFIIRNMKIWEVHYAFRVQSPCVLVEDMTIHGAVYGVYHPNYDRHVYKNMTISATNTEPFNRGHDDDSVQYGSLTVDGLTLSSMSPNGDPLIQITDDNPTGKAETHIRNLKVVGLKAGSKRSIIDSGVGTKPTPKTATSVPIYLHDWNGSGEHLKISRVGSGHLKTDGLDYAPKAPLTGRDVLAAPVKNVAFPKLLNPVDTLPPTTVITSVTPAAKEGLLRVRGFTSDDGEVAKVLVNGRPATSTAPNFREWEATVLHLDEISAHAIDRAGNVEATPHRVRGK